MDWSLLAIPAGALLRNVAGWIENGLQDGKIDKYELKQLGATFLKYCVLALAFMFGFNLDPVTATGATILTDVGITALKKAGTY